MLLITKSGRVWRTKIHQLPERTGQKKGESLTERLEGWQKDDIIATVLDVPTDEEALAKGYLLVVTQKGRVVRVSTSEVKNLYADTLLVNVEENDQVIWAGMSLGESHLLMVSAQGQAIRFNEQDIRPTGIGVQGVWGIKLAAKADLVVGAGLIDQGDQLLVTTNHGMSKRVALESYSVQGRYGKGLRTMSVNSITGPLVAAAVINEDDHVTFLTSNKRSVLDVPVREIPKASRYQSGSRLASLLENQRIVRLLKWGTCSAWPTIKENKALDVAEKPSPIKKKRSKSKSKSKNASRRGRSKKDKQQLKLDLFDN